MELSEANKKAKELYGDKAFCEVNRLGECDICIDESFAQGKKTHKMALLLGWGETWEIAFTMAAERAEENGLLDRPQGSAAALIPMQMSLFAEVSFATIGRKQVNCV